MPIFNVYVRASVLLGQYEADTAEQAEDTATNDPDADWYPSCAEKVQHDGTYAVEDETEDDEG